MAGVTFIEDGGSGGTKAKVTTRGQLVVGSLEYDSHVGNTMTAINTAYNFYAPVAGKRFVITAMLLYADKNVGASDASVEIYEAESATSTTIAESIISIEMPKSTYRDITGLNIILNEGVWLNGKTNDNNIFSTIMGYYVDA